MRVLPVVKAYPVVDQVSFSEAVCVAGLTLDPPHHWVRLFPLDFRGLERAQQFRKYQVIELEAVRSRDDSRPESFAPVLDTIAIGEHLGTDGGSWRQRLPYFDAVMDESMCEIQRRQRIERRSLGVFRPVEVSGLSAAPAPPEFEAAQRAVIAQGSLLGGRTGDARAVLEPLPVKAKFEYRCANPSCGGHSQSLIDWELGALYRRLRANGESESTVYEKVRERFLDDYCGPARDTRFIVGSMLSHPASFLVLGLVHPKRRLAMQDSLF